MINVIYYEINTGRVISQTQTIEGTEEDIRPLFDKENNPKLLGYLNDRAISKVDGSIYNSETDEIITTEIKDETRTTTTILRKIRNKRLTKSDWTQSLDSPLSDTKKNEWAIYRQSLRDLPDNYSDADDIDQIAIPNPPTFWCV